MFRNVGEVLAKFQKILDINDKTFSDKLTDAYPKAFLQKRTIITPDLLANMKRGSFEEKQRDMNKLKTTLDNIVKYYKDNEMRKESTLNDAQATINTLIDEYNKPDPNVNF